MVSAADICSKVNKKEKRNHGMKPDQLEAPLPEIRETCRIVDFTMAGHFILAPS